MFQKGLWTMLLAATLAAGCAAQPVERPRMNSELQAMVDQALADAAQRTRLDRAALRVESAEEVTWTDGSLGCPNPGGMYTMALVPGYRIHIRAGTQLLDYHASRRGPPMLCPAGRAIEPRRDERM